MRYRLLVLLVSVVVFSGCRTFEPEPAIVLPLKIPEHFSIDINGFETIEKWWFFFENDELNSLIKNAVDNNFDLKSLKTRILQAKAGVAKEDSSFFPDLGFSVGGREQGAQVKKSHSSSPDYDGTHSWEGSLNGSYTADVWGETNADKQAQVLNLQAAEQDLKNSTLELTAQIAEIWIDIIAVRNKKIILENQIKCNKTLLQLQQLRFTNGKANALDVSQQREALAEASSQVPLLEKQERLLLNNLSFLSGKALVDLNQVKTKTLPEPVQLPRIGIPSELLKNRPDIQAAEMRLSSAQWKIAAARADLLPSFTMTAQAMFSHGNLDLLFQNWIAYLAGNITGPIFDGGFRKAEIERVKAVAEEQLNVYAKTVAKAIFEVEESLITIQKQETYIKLLEDQLDVARLTLKDAMVQYQNGQSSYLSYLVTWTSIERLERQLIGEQATYAKKRIGLHRTLGWNVPELK